MRTFVQRGCEECGTQYTPTASRQKRCLPCIPSARKRITREGMAASRSRDPDRIRRLEADNLLRNNYGISLSEYEGMFTAQGGKCALCGKPPKGGRGILRKLYVDHCHSSGAVRGLLCTHCNSGLGMFADSIETLTLAMAYLKRFTN